MYEKEINYCLVYDYRVKIVLCLKLKSESRR